MFVRVINVEEVKYLHTIVAESFDGTRSLTSDNKRDVWRDAAVHTQFSIWLSIQDDEHTVNKMRNGELP